MQKPTKTIVTSDSGTNISPDWFCCRAEFSMDTSATPTSLIISNETPTNHVTVESEDSICAMLVFHDIDYPRNVFPESSICGTKC